MTHSREVLTTPIFPRSYLYPKALLTPDLEANVTRGRLGKGQLWLSVVGTVDMTGTNPETRATINPSAPAEAKLVENRIFKPHFRYLPIPQWVIDRNPNFGKNNPDY